MQVVLVLGNQLFHPQHYTSVLKDKSDAIFYMREDIELCTYFRHHKQKILFFLAAMRTFADELREAGFQVHYEKLQEKDSGSFEDSLRAFFRKKRASSFSFFEIEDKFFEKRMEDLRQSEGLSGETWPSPMFLTDRAQFEGYLQKNKRPFMKTFYEAQRKRLKILIDKSGQPTGGQWSFDAENRKPLPKDIKPPNLPKFEATAPVQEVLKIVEKIFAKHPGQTDNLWLPVDRKSAHRWLDDFCRKRLALFGDYEDALAPQSDFVFHSVLTPFLNVGLLTPREVVARVLKQKEADSLPLNSVEGFVRQVIGWREFIRGIYQNFSEEQETKNFWKHTRRLSPHWWRGDSGIEPLDLMIQKTLRFGYAHHIERLMVAGSLMVLLEIDPREAHRWFMEMFVDSSDWVMGPNVYGMALFSDGGIFATKPYICGSNYYKKMGGFKAGDWQEGVDGLYWSFIDRNRSFFLKNPRLSMMAKTLDKMEASKKKRLFEAARALREKLTIASS